MRVESQVDFEAHIPFLTTYLPLAPSFGFYPDPYVDPGLIGCNADELRDSHKSKAPEKHEAMNPSPVIDLNLTLRCLP